MEDHVGAFTQIALILAAAFMGGALLQRLRQPVLVGYIIVGLVLGPSALGIIHDEHQIKLLAEMGILLLLFVIGMELDLKKFAPVYKVALITTALQICVGLGVSTALGHMFDWPLARILLLGFAVSLSSTAVAIKMLQDMGETNTTLGRGAIGILIAQDIAVIPMLLIIGTLDEGNFNPLELTKIALAISFLAFLIIALNKKRHWFSKVTALIPAQNQTAVVALALCFSAAALTDLAGLSAGYGAFLAGLIIGNTTERHAYEVNITPIFDVLMMVFFLSIGLLIDLDFLHEKFWRILALLGAVMFMKTVLNIGILRILGLSRRNAIVMGAILGQVGEFSFILAALGLASGAIHDTGYKYVISIIALSLVITPIWLYAVRQMNLIRYRTYKRARHHGAKPHGK